MRTNYNYLYQVQEVIPMQYHLSRMNCAVNPKMILHQTRIIVHKLSIQPKCQLTAFLSLIYIQKNSKWCVGAGKTDISNPNQRPNKYFLFQYIQPESKTKEIFFISRLAKKTTIMQCTSYIPY